MAVQHVVHISVDGLDAGILQTEIETSPESYPNFLRFLNEGATTFNARTEFTHTETLPNHTSMLTGRPVSQPDGAPDTIHHGWTVNTDLVASFPSTTLHNSDYSGNPNVAYVASVFDVAHDHGFSTALYSGKMKFTLFEKSYNGTNGATDTVGDDDGRDKIDAHVISVQDMLISDGALTTVFVSDLAENEYDYTLLHYKQLDIVGHGGPLGQYAGWGSPEWIDGLQNIDDHLGSVLGVIESDAGLLDDTTIILTGDHGGGGGNGEFPEFDHTDATFSENYTVPLFAWGPDVAAGIDLYDLNSNNRLDPETGRPDFNAATQPIRNGETGNLALDLLGLGPIPGSTINSSQDLQIAFRLGDFDQDGDVDTDDIDFYAGKIGQAENGDLTQLDLDGDSTITLADHDLHITTLVQTSDGGVGASIGDVNLDGQVDILIDGATLIDNLNSAGPFSYRLGDLNADQQVDVLQDAARFVNAFDQSNASVPATSSVPEPASATFMLLATVGIGVRRRKF